MKNNTAPLLSDGSPMVADQFLNLVLEYVDLEPYVSVRDWVKKDFEAAMMGIPEDAVADLQPVDLSEVNDGRPMSTDAFLSLVVQHLSSLESVVAIRDWVEGDWGGALFDIPEEAIARVTASAEREAGPGL